MPYFCILFPLLLVCLFIESSFQLGIIFAVFALLTVIIAVLELFQLQKSMAQHKGFVLAPQYSQLFWALLVLLIAASTDLMIVEDSG